MKLVKTTTIAFALLLVATAVPAQGATVDTGATIGNLVPVVESISVSSSVAPTSGDTTNVPITLTVKDDNGHQDLVAVKVTVYAPDNTTVHVTEAAAVSNEDGNGVSLTYGYAFDMQFYDDPGVYHIKAIAEDSVGALSVVKDQTFTYESLEALSLSASSMAFGSVDPGTTTTAQSLTVQNYGNVQIDLVSSGTDLADGSGHSISADRIKYDLVDSSMGNKQNLTTTTFTNTGFDLVHGPSSTKATYWQLETPSGEEQYLPAGSYTGSITLEAVQG